MNLNFNNKWFLAIGIVGAIIAAFFVLSYFTKDNSTTGFIASNSPNSSTGSIYATSSPSGASVYIDNVYKSLTPATLTNLAIGSHNVKFVKAGYRDVVKTVTVSAGKSITVSASLVVDITQASLSVISSPSGAFVYFDNSYRGSTPLTLSSLLSGDHSVVVGKNGYKNYTTSVKISSGQTSRVTLNISLSSVVISIGSIYATSSPSGAYVYVDNIYKGISPITIANIESGNRNIRFVKSGYADLISSVTVTQNKTVSINGVLIPIIIPACNDSDGGMNFGIQGRAVSGNIAKIDSCNNSTLTEYYCSGSNILSYNFNCLQNNTYSRCSNGACYK
jgi:hypothetical protein